MSDQFAVVSFDVSATGSFNVTSGAITETVKAAILVLTHTQTDDANAAHGIMAMGFVADDGDPAPLNKFCCGYRSTDALTSTQITDSWKFSNGTVLALFSENTTDAADVVIGFTAFISGGLTLNCTAFAGTACRGYAILFAGVSRAFCESISSTAVPASEDCGIATTFQPDLVLFMGSDGGFGGPATLDVGVAAFGATAGSSTASSLIHWNSADPSDGDGRVSDGTLRTINAARTQQSITITIDSTGFDHVASATSPDMAYIALKFSETLPIKVDNLAVSGSAGTQSFAVGFQPQIVFGQSTLITAEDTDTDGSTASSVGLFAFTSTAERAASIHSEEGLTVANPTPTSNAHTRQGSHALLTLSHTGTVAQEAELSSMTATGFDLSFGTATAGLMTIVAIGAGSLELVSSDTERINDQALVILNRTLVVNETVRISDGFGGSELADALPDLPPAGVVLEAHAAQGAVLDPAAGPVAGTILEPSRAQGAVEQAGQAVAGWVFG